MSTCYLSLGKHTTVGRFLLLFCSCSFELHNKTLLKCCTVRLILYTILSLLQYVITDTTLHHNCGMYIYLWKLSTIFNCPRKSFFVRWSNILASTKHSMNVVLYWGSPKEGNQQFPIHSWFMSPNAKVVLEVFGAEGDVRDTISWMASLNFSLWSGLLIPISLCISVSLRALMMAPDLTFALHAATYHAGIPTHNSSHATIVGPFHKANGVPAFMASASSSCR